MVKDVSGFKVSQEKVKDYNAIVLKLVLKLNRPKEKKLPTFPSFSGWWNFSCFLMPTNDLNHFAEIPMISIS